MIIDMRFNVSKNNIHIEDSFIITSRCEMYSILEQLKNIHPDSCVWKRSFFHMSCEWKSHNRMYRLGLYRSHTKDVDLNYPQKWYMKVVYFILGL